MCFGSDTLEVFLWRFLAVNLNESESVGRREHILLAHVRTRARRGLTMMMTLSLSFTYKRVIPSQSASRTRAPRMAAGTRGGLERGAKSGVPPRPPVGGDGPRATRSRQGPLQWHDLGVRERATRLPVLRAITRVEGSGDEEQTEGSAVEAPEAGGSGEKKLKDNQIQLPKVKRSAELTFTCNKCGHRTTRMVNPEVYKKGTMFVQCAGCETWHKMVDNLGLIWEFPAEEQ